MKDRSFFRPPTALRRAVLDNLAIVPASLLPFKSRWQAIANQLPKGEMLIILPASETPSRRTLERITDLLEARGRHVTTISADGFA